MAPAPKLGSLKASVAGCGRMRLGRLGPGWIFSLAMAAAHADFIDCSSSVRQSQCASFNDAFSDGLTDEISSFHFPSGWRPSGRSPVRLCVPKESTTTLRDRRFPLKCRGSGGRQCAARPPIRTHVTVELNRTRDGFTIWSQTYDGTTNDWMQIESQIAGSIARALARKISPNNTPASHDPEAHACTWRRAICGISETFPTSSRAWTYCSRRSRAIPTMPWPGPAWPIL